MTFYKKFSVNKQTQIYAWKITETLDELAATITLNPISQARLNGMKSKSHKKGFLAVRKLLQHLNYTDFDLIYDTSGKPNLNDENNLHISISHSHEFSVIGISKNPIGIDLEMQREKVIKIAERFSVEQFDKIDKQNYIRQLTINWGVKESIFKIENQSGISFKDHIFVNPVVLSNKTGTAILNFQSQTKMYQFYFEELENYTLVCALQAENL